MPILLYAWQHDLQRYRDAAPERGRHLVNVRYHINGSSERLPPPRGLHLRGVYRAFEFAPRRFYDPPTGTCRASAAPATLAATLRKIHLAARHTKTRDAGPVGPISYGNCGSARYALATFDSPATGTTDQPEVFSASVREWHDEAEYGGGLSCAGPVPRGMLHLWGLSCFDITGTLVPA